MARLAFFAPVALLLSLAACDGRDAEKTGVAVPATAAAATVEKPSARLTIAREPGADPERLRSEIAQLFDGTVAGETRALVIMRGGSVIAEGYAPGYSADSKLLGWSLGKTVSVILAGMMVADGRLALDRPAPVAAWATPGDPRGAITLRHLLTMTSGLAHAEDPDSDDVALYDADTPRMLFLDGAADMARFAESRPLEAVPGERYEYSTATTTILCDIMTTALTPSSDPAIRRDAMLAFARGRLFEPLGITSMTPEFDAHGTMIGGAMIHATARDWARIGEFLRHNGSVRNAQIMPTSWPRAMKQPNPAEPGVGMGVWLNRRGRDGGSPLFPDAAPGNVFASLGHRGQYIIVVPDDKLTLVRLGYTEKADQRAVTDQLARIIGLF